jgi:hypothetical protein
MSPRVRRQWTKEDVHRLKLLADGNVSADYIAQSLDRSVASVRQHAASRLPQCVSLSNTPSPHRRLFARSQLPSTSSESLDAIVLRPAHTLSSVSRRSFGLSLME